ncbi:hypothetical protein GINT2_000077 [Glugoides intestinalis]
MYRYQQPVDNEQNEQTFSYEQYYVPEARVFKETNKTSDTNFLDLLVKEIPYEYKLKKFKSRKNPHDPVVFEIDDGHRFRNTVSITKTGNGAIQSFSSSSRNSGIRDFLKKRQLDTEISTQYEKAFEMAPSIDIMPVELVSWESNVLTENEDENQISITEYINELVESKWENHVFIDPIEMPTYKPYMTLYIDDPNLIFEKVEEKKTKIKKKSQKQVSYDKPSKNKHNISNDKYYVSDSKNKLSLGTFGVQHSLPALKLDTKFYKTNHTKEELRNFHRSLVCIKLPTYSFKSHSSTKFVGSVIKKATELTLADSTPFLIFEYFEEYPFFVVNPGMVSLLNTYYRKADLTDESTVDGCIILDTEEEAPFFGFGEVKPGTYMQTLANNLFIAPTVSHKSSDFLCIIEDGSIILRSIDTIRLVGQEFPKEDVYTPHSRKLNQFCKDRLKVAAYRLFSKGKDLQMQQLDQMFPYFSEGSKRKWLKEYSDCIKKGKDNVWVLKDSFSIIGEEDLRKMVTPENICQYESMLSAERRMQDLGYKCLEEDEEDDYDVYSPNWYLSKNFVNAANGKGLLELSGPADPSGSGEAFSFRKIKLKKGCESENRKIIAENQATYKERASSIWRKHIEMLSSTEAAEYTQQPKKTSNFEMASETTTADTACLIIKRTVEEKGSIVVEIEKITDSRVIKAYLKARKNYKSDEKKTSFTCSSCGQTGHMKTNKTCPNYIGSVKTAKKKAEERKAPAIFQEKLLRLISVFMSVPFSNAFHRPVSLKKFPNYAMLIKNPIDLGTIKSKIKTAEYTKYDDFLKDLKQMRHNCVLYNGPSHSLTEIADNIYNQGLKYQQDNTHDIKKIELQIEEEHLNNNLSIE